jgi:hypothetical protein
MGPEYSHFDWIGLSALVLSNYGLKRNWGVGRMKWRITSTKWSNGSVPCSASKVFDPVGVMMGEIMKMVSSSQSMNQRSYNGDKIRLPDSFRR